MIKHKTILTHNQISGVGFNLAVDSTVKGLQPIISEMAKQVDENYSLVVRVNVIDKDGFIVEGNFIDEGRGSPEDIIPVDNNTELSGEGDEAIKIDLDDVEDPFKDVA